MKLFLDSANLQELEVCLQKGFLAGITTNPSILSREPKTNFIEHVRKMVQLCRQYKQEIPLSVEVFTKDADKMFSQGVEVYEEVGYEQLNIKIPIGWDELKPISQLSKRGIPVNCTCIFTEGQALLAAGSGAHFLSIFVGRLRDIGGDPMPIIRNTRDYLDEHGSEAEIIVASVRQSRDVVEGILAGGHIVTGPLKLYQEMSIHPQTTKSVDGFIRDFEQWLK